MGFPDFAPLHPGYAARLGGEIGSRALMFDDLITYHAPPPNRVSSCLGEVEHHFSEGAVMMAFAMHLLRTVPDLVHVAVHPDGEHGKRFAFKDWLQRQGV
jgi:hypothetical protein